MRSCPGKLPALLTFFTRSTLTREHDARLPAPAGRASACRDVIDELKERVLLWKKELFEGGEEWIGRGS
jgi:hypothetical protein